MKVQWQVVDLETNKCVKVDPPFELIGACKAFFDDEVYMPFSEAAAMFGDPGCIKNPVGILNFKPERRR